MTPLLSVAPISERPVQIDRRFVALHLKCAAGTILPDELAELEMMEAMKIELSTREPGVANNAPGSNHGN